MSKATTAFVVAAAFLTTAAGTASAASDQASCVGAYSSHFAQQGMRDEVARFYSRGNQPYSFVAQFHGDLEVCDEQVH